MLVLIVILLLGFMITVAFSVDVAHMHLARAELQSATDAASKAAAQELSVTFDENAAIARGQEIALLNTVNGEPLQMRPSDFALGRSEPDSTGRFVFTPGATPTNTVRAIGRRTSGSASGPVPLFFGNVLGFSTFEPEVVTAATYSERDIVIVVDRSGSMSGSKFADLTAAITVFTQTLDATPVEEEVGLASYSTLPTEDVELTSDYVEINDHMAAMPVGGFTNIGGGMLAADNIMSRGRNPEFVERTIIVMTDGVHNRGTDPVSAATQLAGDNVKIHAITFGAGADQSRMQTVANLGGGIHLHAPTGQALIDAFREIALTFDTVMTE
ncbi:MAG: vWA domain-containing protein [Planctomycetota bacterium]